MEITKRQARDALGFTFDRQLAELFNIGKGAVSAWREDDPLPDARQWQLRALRPDLFPTPAQPTTPAPSAAEQRAA